MELLDQHVWCLYQKSHGNGISESLLSRKDPKHSETNTNGSGEDAETESTGTRAQGP